MTGVERLVEREVKKQIKTQLGLVYTDIKELKEESRNLKQKHFDVLKKVKRLEAERAEATDYGV